MVIFKLDLNSRETWSMQALGATPVSHH